MADSNNKLQEIETAKELKNTETIPKIETNYVIGSNPTSIFAPTVDPQIRDLEERLSAQSQKIHRLSALQDEILEQLCADEEQFQDQITTLLKGWRRIARDWQMKFQNQKGEISQLAQVNDSILDSLRKK